jgi:hypothetical protein
VEITSGAAFSLCLRGLEVGRACRQPAKIGSRHRGPFGFHEVSELLGDLIGFEHGFCCFLEQFVNMGVGLGRRLDEEGSSCCFHEFEGLSRFHLGL